MCSNYRYFSDARQEKELRAKLKANVQRYVVVWIHVAYFLEYVVAAVKLREIQFPLISDGFGHFRCISKDDVTILDSANYIKGETDRFIWQYCICICVSQVKSPFFPSRKLIHVNLFCKLFITRFSSGRISLRIILPDKICPDASLCGESLSAHVYWMVMRFSVVYETNSLFLYNNARFWCTKNRARILPINDHDV